MIKFVLISPQWNVNNIESIPYLKNFSVLISPQWNVNNTKRLKNYSSSCFNLTLVECKLTNLAPRISFSSSFNLTLVECKCEKKKVCWQPCKVLISPQWNVNENYGYTRSYILGVLISPQWNVNCYHHYSKKMPILF